MATWPVLGDSVKMKELLLEEHMECGCQEREKYRSPQDPRSSPFTIRPVEIIFPPSFPV
jgi:hypothetical protein